MATAPPFEGTQEEWDRLTKITQKALSDREDLHNAYRNQNFLTSDGEASFLHGGRKYRRKSRGYSKKSRKSRRYSKKSRKCRR